MGGRGSRATPAAPAGEPIGNNFPKGAQFDIDGSRKIRFEPVNPVTGGLQGLKDAKIPAGRYKVLDGGRGAGSAGYMTFQRADGTGPAYNASRGQFAQYATKPVKAPSKASRRGDLAQAQKLAASGKRAEAKALFAKHGIQYNG